MTEILEGQVDLFAQDGWSGKTSPVRSPQTKAKISESSLKRPQGSQTRLPLFLDLREGSGNQQDASWEMGGVLLGEYMMHSFGESPSEENESHLSQILQGVALPKYSLSAKACLGILNRASRRGKELPEILKTALENQVEANQLCDPEN